jgi:hypothetical protein
MAAKEISVKMVRLSVDDREQLDAADPPPDSLRSSRSVLPRPCDKHGSGDRKESFMRCGSAPPNGSPLQ